MFGASGGVILDVMGFIGAAPRPAAASATTRRPAAASASRSLSPKQERKGRSCLPALTPSTPRPPKTVSSAAKERSPPSPRRTSARRLAPPLQARSPDVHWAQRADEFYANALTMAGAVAASSPGTTDAGASTAVTIDRLSSSMTTATASSTLEITEALSARSAPCPRLPTKGKALALRAATSARPVLPHERPTRAAGGVSTAGRVVLPACLPSWSPHRPVGLGTQWEATWDEETSPTWGRRKCAAWGGVGYHFERLAGSAEDDHGGVGAAAGWDEHIRGAVDEFETRHALMARAAQSMMDSRPQHDVHHRLRSVAPADVEALETALLSLRSSRYTVQPLRLASSHLSPRSSPRGCMPRAIEEWKKPIALAASSSGGGPLLPVYQRVFATDAVPTEEEEEAEVEVEAEAEEEEAVEWSLYGSLWGPRCEWCDGRDFIHHAQLSLERFVSDLQVALRLGVVKLITDNDDDGAGGGGGAAAGGGDGAVGLSTARGAWVSGEVLDVALVLHRHHELCCLAFSFYADAVYRSGSDLDIGVKVNDGWKAFTIDCGIWDQP